MIKRDPAHGFVRQIFTAITAVITIHLVLSPTQLLAANPVEHEHIRTQMSGKTGPVVVLIPGMSTPAEVWSDTVEALEPDHSLLVVEVRGFDGERGTANEQPGMIDGIIADLARDLDARQLTADAVVGHSFGGLLALKFSLSHPDRVKQLMVIDALPFAGLEFGPDATAESVAPRADRIRATITAQAEAMRAAGRTGVESAPANGMSINPEIATRVTNWSMKSEPLATAQAVFELITTDLREEISNVTMPVTVLYAAGDEPAKSAEKFSRNYAALAGSDLVPVENSAHFIMLDRPDAFQTELKEMLSQSE